MNDIHVIITKNVYLRIALTKLLNFYLGTDKICVVDLCSYNTLLSLKREVDTIETINKYKVILLGDRNIYSCMLGPLGVQSANLSIKELFCYIKSAKGISMGELKEFIESLLQLTFLNNRQILVCTLYSRYNLDMKMASRILGITEKTAYGVTACSVKLMNLKSLSHLAFFLTNDFHISKLNKLFFC